MANPIIVQIAKSVESLAHHKGSLGLRQVLSLGDVEEQLTSFAKSNCQVLDPKILTL